MSNLEATLYDLDHATLYHLADYHEQLAVKLRARAQKVAQYQDMQSDNKRKLKFLKKLPETVRRYLRQGYGLAQAQTLTAEHSDVPVATVQHHWTSFIRSKDKAALQARNNLIMDLAAIKMKNAQIGERVGLHEKSVSRIISREKRKRLVWSREEHPDLLDLTELRRKKGAESRPLKLRAIK